MFLKLINLITDGGGPIRGIYTPRFRFLVILLCLTQMITDNWKVNGHLLASRSHNILKRELRPYTVPEDRTPGQTDFPTRKSLMNKILYPTLSDMTRICDGQCFYAPASCMKSVASCKVTASIAMHNMDKDGQLYCDFFGTNNVKEAFCYNSASQVKYREENSQQPDAFYTITLQRAFGNVKLDQDFEDPTSSCPNIWSEKTGERCRRMESIGISFGKGSSDQLEDLWYVCTAGESSESRVTMWTNISSTETPDSDVTPAQLTDTSPHPNAGMGVVFSKVVFDDYGDSMGCQFVIQESNMTLDNASNNAAFFKSREPTFIKLAVGYVERGFVKGDPNNYKKIKILRPFFKGDDDYNYFVIYENADIGPSNAINFERLNVTLDRGFAHSFEEEEDAHFQIDIIINKCADPQSDPDIYIACYPPKDDQSCVINGDCEVMFVVESPKSDTSFNKIKAYIFSRLVESPYEIKVKKPVGYASVGFSNDTYMGRDVVITCHANGINNTNLYVSINYQKNNVYPGKVDYSSLISNPQSFATTDIILCSWEMETFFSVNMMEYEPEYLKIKQPETSDDLKYDFRSEEVFLLFAAGNMIYPKGTIVYHDFRQVLPEKFSKQLFLEKALGNKLVISKMLLIVCFYSILFLYKLKMIFF